MELEGIPLKSERNIASFFSDDKKKDEIQLTLSIAFNEQWVSFPGGRIKFGLKCGELELILRNCESPISFRDLCDDFNLSVIKTRQHTTKKNTKKSAQAKPHNVGINTSSDASEEVKDIFEFVCCQVTTKGSSINPSWIFEVQTHEPVLKGKLSKANLCKVIGHANSALPWHIKASFQASPRDLEATAGEGVWFMSLSPAKRAVLDRGIARLILKHKMNESCMSLVELQSCLT